MNKLKYFTNRVLKAGFINTLNMHRMVHLNSKLTTTPKYLDSVKKHVINIMKKMSI